jgi:hypothetical protein
MDTDSSGEYLLLSDRFDGLIDQVKGQDIFE